MDLELVTLHFNPAEIAEQLQQQQQQQPMQGRMWLWAALQAVIVS
jgi:hypothetical protein